MVMASKLLLPLALAASCTASVLPLAPRDSHKNWVTYPIAHERQVRTITRRDQDVPLFNITSVSYLIELSIGTPGQSIKVAIDTGSDELWVNPDCTSSTLTSSQRKECVAIGQYNPSKSSTAKKLSTTNSIQYGKGSVSLSYVKDNIALPQSTINVTSAQFGVATASEDLNEGILGLGWGNGFNLDYNNFIDDLAEQSVTKSRAFSVALGSVDANNGGVLIFGGVDTKKFTGPLVNNKILGPQNKELLHRYWVQMNSITLSRSGQSAKSYSGANLPVVVDSGSSLSYLPNSIVKAMAADFSGQLDTDSGLYLVPCSQTTQGGTVDFVFGSATIKVPFSEWIWKYDSSTCILGAVGTTSSSGITALLGDTFMRSAFVVFDQDHQTISMAQYANCGENEQEIPAGGAANFTGECQVGGATKNTAVRTAYSGATLAIALLAGLMLTL